MTKGAGPLRHRITLEKQADQPDDFTGTAPTWQTVGGYWAEIRPLIGRELARVQEVHPQTTHRIVMRRQPTRIKSVGYRIRWDDRLFDIAGYIEQQEKNAWWLIDAIEHLESNG